MPFGSNASIKESGGSVTSRHAKEGGGGSEGLGCGTPGLCPPSSVWNELSVKWVEVGGLVFGFFFCCMVVLRGLGNDKEILSGI